MTTQREIHTDPSGLIGASTAMERVRETITRAAQVEMPVLISGESGTGKELVAGAIYNASRRRTNSFVAVNTGALTRELVLSELFGHVRGAFTDARCDNAGRFAEARGGTLFLDEIATMSESAQVALLRVLENHTYRPVGATRDREADVRLISATNVDLAERVQEGLFRADLFHRLQVLHISVPSLRDHLEDLPQLVQHFVHLSNAEFELGVEGVSARAFDLMLSHSWPGNVRELKNVILSAAVLLEGGEIDVEHLPPRLAREDGANSISVTRAAPAEEHPRRNGTSHPRHNGEPARNGGDSRLFPPPVGSSLREVEKAYVIETLKRTDNNKTNAARMLGISRKTLYDKLNRWEC